MRPLGWPQSNLTGILVRRDNFNTQEVCTSRKDPVSTQWIESHLQAKKRGLRRNQPCRHLDLGLPASRMERKYVCWLSLWNVVTATLANSHLLLSGSSGAGSPSGTHGTLKIKEEVALQGAKQNSHS